MGSTSKSALSPFDVKRPRDRYLSASARGRRWLPVKRRAGSPTRTRRTRHPNYVDTDGMLTVVVSKEFEVSVTVIVCGPADIMVTLKEPVPFVKEPSGGRTAWLSELLKCTVPL